MHIQLAVSLGSMTIRLQTLSDWSVSTEHRPADLPHRRRTPSHHGGGECTPPPTPTPWSHEADTFTPDYGCGEYTSGQKCPLVTRGGRLHNRLCRWLVHFPPWSHEADAFTLDYGGGKCTPPPPPPPPPVHTRRTTSRQTTKVVSTLQGGNLP